MKFFLLTASTLCLLTSCTTQKNALEGNRENFIASGTFKPCPLLSSKQITPTAPWKNTTWPASHTHLNIMATEASKLLWETSIGKGVSSGLNLQSNMVANHDYIFTMDAAGNISAINQLDGKTAWAFKAETTSDNALSGGLALDNKTLIATSSSGDVIGIHSKDGTKLWQINVEAPIRIGATTHEGTAYVLTVSNELIALSVDTGKIRWRHQGINEFSAILGGSKPTISGSTLVAAYSSGEYYALDLKTGNVLWSDTLTAALRSDTVSSITHIVANPVIDNGTVYVISHGGKMVATDIKTGNRVWQQNIGSILTPLSVGDFLFIVSDLDELVCVDKKSGKTRFSVNLQAYKDQNDTAKVNFSAPLLVDGKVLVTASNGEMLYISIQDGKLLKKFTTDQKVKNGPIIVNGKYFLLASDGTLTSYQ